MRESLHIYRRESTYGAPDESLHIDRKKSYPPKGVFLCVYFFNEEPAARGPLKNNRCPLQNNPCFQRKSSSSGLFIWKSPKREPRPPRGGGSFDQYTDENLYVDLLMRGSPWGFKSRVDESCHVDQAYNPCDALQRTAIHRNTLRHTYTVMDDH